MADSTKRSSSGRARVVTIMRHCLHSPSEVPPDNQVTHPRLAFPCLTHPATWTLHPHTVAPKLGLRLCFQGTKLKPEKIHIREKIK